MQGPILFFFLVLELVCPFLQLQRVLLCSEGFQDIRYVRLHGFGVGRHEFVPILVSFAIFIHQVFNEVFGRGRAILRVISLGHNYVPTIRAMQIRIITAALASESVSASPATT